MGNGADQVAGGGRDDRPGGGAMFDRIAARYDAMNRILSFGIDRGWRRRTVRAIAPRDGDAILDLATGTGDLALALARACPGARIDGTDPSAGMIAEGNAKIAALGLGGRVRLGEGSAESIAAADASYDAVTIAFGIRNVPDRPRALREMARVLKPGGRLAILELTEPTNGVVGAVARFHVHAVVPRLGALLSGADAYRYLARSIAAFPPPASFAATMAEAGLADVRAIPLTFGVCTLFLATRRSA